MKIIDLHQDILIHQDNQNQYKYKNQTSLDQIMNSDIGVVFGTGFVFGENDNFFAPNCMNLIEQDIEEVATRLKLRGEIWKLHTGFLKAVAPSISGGSPAAARKKASRNT